MQKIKFMVICPICGHGIWGAISMRESSGVGDQRFECCGERYISVIYIREKKEVKDAKG